jgi:hypothetical protein
VTKVFIGGSRKIGRLGVEVRRRLDRIIEKKIQVLIGDANGADKAVQMYLKSRGYDRVEVFCMDGVCRNNVGGWVTRGISAPRKTRGFEYYSVKDAEMTNESTVGFMIWDGSSRGTLSNISRLIEQDKKVVVYVAPLREFVTLSSRDECESFVGESIKVLNKSASGHHSPHERHPGTRS